MKKRIVTVGLWLYVGWYAGTIMSELVGVSPLVALVPAVAAAVLIAVHTSRQGVAERN